MILRLILISILFLTFPNTGNAQDNDLEGYTPPPMFGAPRVEEPAYGGNEPATQTPAPVKKTQPIKVAPKQHTKTTAKPVIIEKIDSKAVKVQPSPKLVPAKPNVKKQVKQKPVAPKVVIPKKAPRVQPIVEILQYAQKPKPVEQVAPITDAIKSKPKPDVKQTQSLEPIDYINKQKATSQGIVKGPKTMPAIKKQGVESEVLFAPEVKKPSNLLDRVQQTFSKKKKVVEIAPEDKILKPTTNYDRPKFNVMADGNRKLNLIFAPTDMILGNDNGYAVQELILPLLKENQSMRLRLESFASPQEESITGDRRVSLARVMSMRQYLINNGIEASRFDVRSLGADTQTQPMDRIEIYLIN